MELELAESGTVIVVNCDEMLVGVGTGLTGGVGAFGVVEEMLVFAIWSPSPEDGDKI